MPAFSLRVMVEVLEPRNFSFKRHLETEPQIVIFGITH